MSKKVINQNTNYNTELLDSIGSNFIFNENPINRIKNEREAFSKNPIGKKINKVQELSELSRPIFHKFYISTPHLEK